MDNHALCFSADRICHHDDYCAVISKFTPVINVKFFSEKIRGLLSKKTIFFLDIDSYDLFFAPLIVVRSLWGGKGCGISVRTEYLVENISFKHFLFNIHTSKYFHALVKRVLFFVIRKFSKTTIISIHKRHPLSDAMSKYVDGFVYDPQLWDLPLLQPSASRPVEISEDFFTKERTIVLIAGRLNEQRSRKELLQFLTANPEEKCDGKLHYVIAGNLETEDEVLLRELSYCTVINRFTTNEELHYLMTESDVIYCFYTNDRPSGFFGRATQLNKTILTRANGYLHCVYHDYPNQFPLNNLNEFNIVSLGESKSPVVFNGYDDSFRFREILSGLQ